MNDSQKDLNSSIPDLTYHYKQACVKLFDSDNSSKLIIFSCNLLVTSSCTLSKYPVVCVGPSASSFTPSKNTKIFLHEKSVEMADKLFYDKGCSQIYPCGILNQCKQVRPKFFRVETYSCCRSSSTYTLGHIYQPYTIWTLYDYDSAQMIDSQAKLGSLLFQKIAQSMSSSLRTANETVKERLTKKFS